MANLPGKELFRLDPRVDLERKGWLKGLVQQRRVKSLTQKLTEGGYDHFLPRTEIFFQPELILINPCDHN